MAFEPVQERYDRAKTIFSPDGRLYQVEYARAAVHMGATALGVVFKNGVILAAKKTIAKLQVDNAEKVFKIDDHVGVVTSGLIADARVLVDAARQEAQRNAVVYDEVIHTYSLAKFIADRKQAYTQYGGVRPYGSAMLIGGVTDTGKLFQTDPSGILKEWQAIAIGRGAEQANGFFEKKFEGELDERGAMQLAIDALSKAEEGLTSKDIEMAVILPNNKFKFVTSTDFKKLGLKI